MSLPRYPEYKDSGIAWLGSVPKHWDVVQSRRYFKDRNERARESDRQLTASQKHGMLYQADFMQLEGQKVTQVILGADILKHVEPNDFVISMRSFQGGLEWCRLQGSMSSAYIALTPKDSIHPPFFAHLFKSSTYVQALQATTNLVRDGQALRFSNFAQVSLPLMPLSEQQAIAAFLDREIAKIDALIAEQEELIALLAEKCQATISQAVTKGLNPDAPMKDSGVPWLGEVPAHWDLKSIKRLVVSIEQGWSPQCDADAIGEDDGFGVLKVGCVNGGTFNHAENKRLPDDLQPLTQYALKEGDLLISRANTRELVGSAAVVPRDCPNLLLCDKLYRLRLDVGQCTPEFLAAFLLSSLGRSQIEVAATGASSSMLNIGQSVILDMPVPLPSPSEQCKIMDALQQELSHLRALSYDALSMIELLKERRSALIAAAVTGQIDVRGAVSAKAA